MQCIEYSAYISIYIWHIMVHKIKLFDTLHAKQCIKMMHRINYNSFNKMQRIQYKFYNAKNAMHTKHSRKCSARNNIAKIATTAKHNLVVLVVFVS